MPPNPEKGPRGPQGGTVRTPRIHPTAVIIDSELGDWTEVGDRSSLIETRLGDFSYVERDSQAIYARVGRFCSIASGVRINPGNHPLERAALHHFTYRSRWYGLAGDDDEGFFEWRRSQPVILGDDVWLGHGAVVLPGRTVGTGAAVGAGAVVTRDVPPFTVAAGVPAVPVRERFSKHVQEGLMRIAWWSWPWDRLRRTLNDFRSLDAEAFVAKYDTGRSGGGHDGHV